MARGLKFRIKVVEGLCYPCSENKDAEQLRGNREADLCLCFRICKIGFSHGEAQMTSMCSCIFSEHGILTRRLRVLNNNLRKIFLKFFIKIYAVGNLYNRLNEAILKSSQNMF